MQYNIKSFTGKFSKTGELEKLEVTIEDGNRVKKYFATNKPCAGYKFLTAKDTISDKLLQEVAAAGMKVTN
jgi:hypothetical protein